MRNLLAAALLPTQATAAQELVTRSFWSEGSGRPGETVDLAARRAAAVAKTKATTDAALHLLAEE